MRQNITEYMVKHVAKKGSVAMGRLYYNDLKAAYCSDESPRKSVQALGPTLPVSAEIMAAMLSGKLKAMVFAKASKGAQAATAAGASKGANASKQKRPSTSAMSTIEDMFK